jgi:alpha-ketoglutarate-dependent taurine dioxygenase
MCRPLLHPKTSSSLVFILNEALLEWKVIFFRNQDITSEQQLAFARNFGDLEVHPFYQVYIWHHVSKEVKVSFGF